MVRWIPCGKKSFGFILPGQCKMDLPKHIYIIGAGGVTSYFLPAFIKTVSHSMKQLPRIHIFDGDVLEERNLTRQLFDGRMVDRNKAESLVKMYRGAYRNMAAHPTYFHQGIRTIKGSLILVFVDNHPARKSALWAADHYGCTAIIAANEYTDSQAMWYEPEFRDTPLDPRVRYPEILVDEEGDPVRSEGCTTEQALTAAPQLAIANFACASHALQLFWFYFKEMDGLRDRQYYPIEHSNNFNKLTTRVEEYYAGRQFGSVEQELAAGEEIPG